MIRYIWIIFTVIFFLFSLYHFYRATKSFNRAPNVSSVKTINGLPLGIHEFIESFNSYIDTLNKDNRIINIVTGLAYLSASATSLFSSFLS